MKRLMSASYWRQPGMHPVRASLGGLIGLIVTAFATAQLLPAGSALPYLVAPLGATAVLVFALPAAPLAQPRAVIGGNILSALCGVLITRLIPDPMIAGPVAAGTAIFAMHLARCLHPPGGAVALVAVFGGEAVRASGFSFAVLPVGIGSAMLVALGFVINTLGGSRYPHRPEFAPAPTTDDKVAVDRSGFDRRDVEAALNQMGDRPDVAVEDVDILLRAVEAAAFVRQRPAPLCLDIMSRDVVTCRETDRAEDALAVLDARSVSALPVLDEDGRVLGIAPRAVLAGEGGRPVADVMQTGACIALADSPAAALVPILSDGVHHQAVIVWNNGRLAGLITQTDLLASLWRRDQH